MTDTSMISLGVNKTQKSFKPKKPTQKNKLKKAISKSQSDPEQSTTSANTPVSSDNFANEVLYTSAVSESIPNSPNSLPTPVASTVNNSPIYIDADSDSNDFPSHSRDFILIGSPESVNSSVPTTTAPDSAHDKADSRHSAATTSQPLVSLGINKSNKSFKPTIKKKTERVSKKKLESIGITLGPPDSAKPSIDKTTPSDNQPVSTENTPPNATDKSRSEDQSNSEEDPESTMSTLKHTTSQPLDISLGINKSKKSFEPIINRRSQRVSKKKPESIGIPFRSPDSAKPNTVDSTPSDNQPVSIENTPPNATDESRSKEQSNSEEDSESTMSTLELMRKKPQTMQDLTRFLLETAKKIHEKPEEKEPVRVEEKPSAINNEFTGYFDTTEDPVYMYVEGYRVKRVKIKSDEHLKEITESIREARRQRLGSDLIPYAQRAESSRKRKEHQLVRKDYKPEGLKTPLLRRRKLAEVSTLDPREDESDESENRSNKRLKSTNVVVPQVKIVNGEIQLDQDSLVADRSAWNYDPLPADGSKVRRRPEVKTPKKGMKWTELETQVFYDGLSLFGTNFEKIAETIPDKTRKQVKAKYKAEETKFPEKIGKYLDDIHLKLDE